MLTPKQQRFVDEYLVDLNASAAYVRAGYAARGNVAEVNASRLLRNAQVAGAITAAKAQRSERTRIDADWVLRTTPLQRLGDPDDVAAAMVFLASPEARHITGQTLTIDGGQLIKRGD